MLLLHSSLYSCLIFLMEVGQHQDRKIERAVGLLVISVPLGFLHLRVRNGRKGGKSMTSRCVFLPLSCSKTYLLTLRMLLYLQKAIKCLFQSVFSLGLFFASILVFPVTNFYPDKYTRSALINTCRYVLTCHWRACQVKWNLLVVALITFLIPDLSSISPKSFLS